MFFVTISLTTFDAFFHIHVTCIHSMNYLCFLHPFAYFNLFCHKFHFDKLKRNIMYTCIHLMIIHNFKYHLIFLNIKQLQIKLKFPYHPSPVHVSCPISLIPQSNAYSQFSVQLLMFAFSIFSYTKNPIWHLFVGMLKTVQKW